MWPTKVSMALCRERFFGLKSQMGTCGSERGGDLISTFGPAAGYKYESGIVEDRCEVSEKAET